MVINHWQDSGNGAKISPDEVQIWSANLNEEKGLDFLDLLSDAEKIEVQKIQRSGDGALRCYISGKIIDLENNAIEYDHLQAFVNGGETDTSNIRIFFC